MTAIADSLILPDTTMGALLEAMPGARRALFARYHIGGCASCAFSMDETVAQVCARNENIDPEEMIAHLLASGEEDARMSLSPAAAADFLKSGAPVRLLDVRSREEFEAVALPGAELMTQEKLQALFQSDKTAPVIVYCHTGARALDTAAYLIGHGFTDVKCLTGGIDAWSREVDAAVPRYRLEMD